MASLTPELAPVRPRVRGTGLDSPRLLEEVVEEHVEESPTGIVWLVGQAGAGKSTSLAHLSAVFPDDSRYVFLDDADDLQSERKCESFRLLSESRLVLAARRSPIKTGHRQLYLESWGIDELVEYLLATHHEQCGEVMQRLGAKSSQAWTPMIARILLDQFALDTELVDAETALRAYLQQELPDSWQLKAARQLCLAYQIGGKESLHELPLNTKSLPESVKQLLLQKDFQVPLAAEQIVTALDSWRSSSVLEQQLPLQLVEAIGKCCRTDLSLRQRLERIVISRRNVKSHAMAASILKSADQGWRPSKGILSGYSFHGAYFSEVNWPESSFTNAHLELAEFFEANLAHSCFDEAIVVETDFVKANLHLATFRKALATGADFNHANLRCTDFTKAKLENANLESADLRQAKLVNANMCMADLSNACLQGADLTDAVLVCSTLTNVDLRQCNLTGVDARRVDLRTAQLEGACLEKALLSRANLEHVRFKNASLRGARMFGAHFTGSWLPSADLRNANLSTACLGEIEWENADLYGANLSGATFHMGSSRSGLVDSPLASEGTRTGFYTDDLEALYFKSPEEVRKANLRGADLRGADILHVDFYLVDLRDAKLDARQLAQARQTGAILSDHS